MGTEHSTHPDTLKRRKYLPTKIYSLMYILFMHFLGFLFFLCDLEYQSKTEKEVYSHRKQCQIFNSFAYGMKGKEKLPLECHVFAVKKTTILHCKSNFLFLFSHLITLKTTKLNLIFLRKPSFGLDYQQQSSTDLGILKTVDLICNQNREYGNQFYHLRFSITVWLIL